MDTRVTSEFPSRKRKKRKTTGGEFKEVGGGKGWSAIVSSLACYSAHDTGKFATGRHKFLRICAIVK